MKRIFLSLLLTFLTFSFMSAQETLVSGGKNRNIIVYAPNNLPQNRPLLISMHGMNQSAAYQSSQANYQAVADTAQFLVVYPDGEGNGWDLGSSKDINFISDIIDAMSTRYKIDKNRVYLSGFSMGGMMTYYAMTKLADKIAAFAPVSGYNMGGPNATSSRPIPIFHVHGTGDDVCTYGPVQSHIDAWVKRNGCSTTAEIVKPLSGPSNTSATIARYRNGINGVEVAHLRLPDKGHWHSNDPAVAMTNVEIWNFCKRWTLQGASSDNGNYQNAGTPISDNSRFDGSTGKYYFYNSSYCAFEFSQFSGKKVAEYPKLHIACDKSSTAGYRLDIRVKKSNGEYFSEVTDGVDASTHYFLGNEAAGTRSSAPVLDQTYDLKSILAPYLAIDPNCTIETVRINTAVNGGSEDTNKTGKDFLIFTDMSLVDSKQSAAQDNSIDIFDFPYYNYDEPQPKLQAHESVALDGKTSYENGAVIYGDGNVYYLNYADLEGFTHIYVEGEGAIRFLFNRETDGGSVVEVIPQYTDGKAYIDLTQYDQVHLHAIKVPYGGSAKVKTIKVFNINGKVEPVVPQATAAFGDLNADGKIDNVDFILLGDYILNMKTPTADELKKYDINRDGVISTADMSSLSALMKK